MRSDGIDWLKRVCAHVFSLEEIQLSVPYPLDEFGSARALKPIGFRTVKPDGPAPETQFAQFVYANKGSYVSKRIKPERFK